MLPGAEQRTLGHVGLLRPWRFAFLVCFWCVKNYPGNLSQWLTGFELLGIPFLVGKIQFKLFFSGSIG